MSPTETARHGDFSSAGESNPRHTLAREEPRPGLAARDSLLSLSNRDSGVSLPQRLLDSGPAIVGASGGSGTRVVARIVKQAGLFIGTELNESEDAWRFGDFSDRWINIYLSHRDQELPPEIEGAMLDDLSSLLIEHCAGLAQGRPWGWKEPRSIYLLPFFHRHLPALRFLHVVRDGRDMAFSVNQNQLRKHGDAALIPSHLSPPVRSMALWSWVNLAAARYGVGHLRDRYLRIRFEDLCARPVAVVGEITGFLGLAVETSAMHETVTSPASLGRWQDESPATIAALEEQGATALVELGYERARS